MFALPVLADLTTVVTVSDRTEVRARLPGSSPPATSIDLETAPQLRLTLATRRMRYAFAYTPLLTMWDLNVTGVRPVLLHGGDVRGEWIGRRMRLSLDESASYGGVNFSAASPAPGPDGTPPRVDVVPAPRVIDFASSTTTLASRLNFRRWTTELSIGYQLAGGATADAREALPFQSGPFGEAALTRAMTRIDDLSTTVSASEASFSSGPESLLTEADEGWRHHWSRIAETRFTAGVSEARVRLSANAPHTLETYPVAEGIFEQRMPTLDARLGVRLGPVVNRLLGTVDERIQGTLALTRTSGQLVSHAYAGAGQSVDATGPNAIRVLSGELGLAYDTNEGVIPDIGVRGLWQRQASTLADLLQVTVFMGVTLRAPPARL